MRTTLVSSCKASSRGRNSAVDRRGDRRTFGRADSACLRFFSKVALARFLSKGYSQVTRNSKYVTVTILINKQLWNWGYGERPECTSSTKRTRTRRKDITADILKRIEIIAIPSRAILVANIAGLGHHDGRWARI